MASENSSSSFLISPVITTTMVPPSPSLISLTHKFSIKLSRDNFFLWKTQIVPYLRGLQLFSFVDCSHPPSPETLSSSDGAKNVLVTNPAFLLWAQHDQIILSTLICSMSENLIAAQVVDCSTSSEVWQTLEQMFALHSRARIMQVHYQLATLKKRPLSISNYFQELKGVVDVLAVVGQQPLNNFEMVCYLLASLGLEYDSLVTLQTTRIDPMDLDDLYGHLLSHEIRLEK